jgi:hypothetical protein
MTVEWAARLEALGFAWGGTKASAARPRAANPRPEWEAQLARLVAFKAWHGDCNVPHRWAEDRKLGSWVQKQRLRKKKLDRGEPGDGMTAEWAARLEALGFGWNARHVCEDAAVAPTECNRKRRAPEGEVEAEAEVEAVVEAEEEEEAEEAEEEADSGDEWDASGSMEQRCVERHYCLSIICPLSIHYLPRVANSNYIVCPVSRYIIIAECHALSDMWLCWQFES